MWTVCPATSRPTVCKFTIARPSVKTYTLVMIHIDIEYHAPSHGSMCMGCCMPNFWPDGLDSFRLQT
jgi:hypothetical protein